MNNLTNTIKTAAVAYLSFSAVQKIATTMTEAAGSLEAYRGTLNVVMKDQVKAANTMAWAVNFANRTPFETDSVVEATVKLESYGLKAMDVLPRVGDMAAVMNKDVIQAVEAVADAQNGELERLKEFGITKKQIIEHGEKQLGLMNLVNKKGQINDQKVFNKALFSLMEDRFSGGMEQQANMYNGIMSTISGVWKTGLATMSGVTMTGEIADGSLFHMLKVNAKSLAGHLTKAIDDGTFERAGKRVAAFFKFIGSGIDLAKAGMKKAWPYIKKTGKIIGSLINKSIKSIKKLKPTFELIGKKVNWFKKVFITGFNKARIVVEQNQPKLIAFKNTIIDLGGKVKSVLGRAFEIVQPSIKWIFENGLPLVSTALLGVIGFASDLYDQFASKWPLIEPTITAIGDGIKNGLVLGFELAKPLVEWLINDGFPIMSDVIGEVLDIAMDIYNYFNDNWSIIEPIVVGITLAFASYKAIMLGMNVVNAISLVLTTGLAAATTALAGAVAFLTSPIFLVIAAIAAVGAAGWAIFKNWDEIMAWFKETFNSFIGWVAPIADGIGGAFQSAYDWIVKTWGGIGEWFEGLWEGVGEAGKGFINFFLKGVNWIIDGINKISFDIPDWIPEVGGKQFGFNIPNVPYLAKGGITTGPTLAMIGEGKEQEAVLPLSKLSGLLNLAILRSRKMEEKETFKKNNLDDKIERFSKVTNINNRYNTTIEYKQEFKFYGDVDKKEVKDVVNKGFEEFKRNTRDTFDRNKRLSFR